MTEAQGIPVLLRFGAVRLAPNLVWYADFTSDQRANPGRPEQTRRFDFRLKPKIAE
jgi:hypothetical protein